MIQGRGMTGQLWTCRGYRAPWCVITVFSYPQRVVTTHGLRFSLHYCFLAWHTAPPRITVLLLFTLKSSWLLSCQIQCTRSFPLSVEWHCWPFSFSDLCENTLLASFLLTGLFSKSPFMYLSASLPNSSSPTDKSKIFLRWSYWWLPRLSFLVHLPWVPCTYVPSCPTEALSFLLQKF